MSDESTQHGAETAQKVFEALHGMYGNHASSRFADGATDENGIDKGIKAAHALWSNALEKFPRRVAMAALAKCVDAHPKFPPTLPEFMALCKSLVPYRIERPFNGAAPRLGHTPAKREAEFSAIRGILRAAIARGAVPRRDGGGGASDVPA